MIVINRKPNEIEVKGHAGYGKKGEDIVCSAVSILTYTILAYLMQRKEIKVQDAVIKDGYAYLKWRPPQDESCNAVIDALCVGYEILQQNYPDHVQYAHK